MWRPVAELVRCNLAAFLKPRTYILVIPVGCPVCFVPRVDVALLIRVVALVRTWTAAVVTNLSERYVP